MNEFDPISKQIEEIRIQLDGVIKAANERYGLNKQWLMLCNTKDELGKIMLGYGKKEAADAEQLKAYKVMQDLWVDCNGEKNDALEDLMGKYAGKYGTDALKQFIRESDGF